jgi:hypothetical protein
MSSISFMVVELPSHCWSMKMLISKPLCKKQTWGIASEPSLP